MTARWPDPLPPDEETTVRRQLEAAGVDLDAEIPCRINGWGAGCSSADCGWAAFGGDSTGWSGMDEIQGRLDAAKADAAFRAELRELGEEIATDVKNSRPGAGVPVDTGALRASIEVAGPGRTGRPQVRISAGGPAAPYALTVHEDLTAGHDLGESRYFVRAVERKAGKR